MVKNFLFTALRGPRKLVNSFVLVVQRTQKVSIVEPKHYLGKGFQEDEVRYLFNGTELTQGELDFLNKKRYELGLNSLEVEQIDGKLDDNYCPLHDKDCKVNPNDESCQVCVPQLLRNETEDNWCPTLDVECEPDFTKELCKTCSKGQNNE